MELQLSGDVEGCVALVSVLSCWFNRASAEACWRRPIAPVIARVNLCRRSGIDAIRIAINSDTGQSRINNVALIRGARTAQGKCVVALLLKSV